MWCLQPGVFDFGSRSSPVVLLLDRCDDPVTPLLMQWTYQVGVACVCPALLILLHTLCSVLARHLLLCTNVTAACAATDMLNLQDVCGLAARWLVLGLRFTPKHALNCIV
jgi:hypothetical protein